MTCKQLGGACDLEFRGETFEEIAEMSKAHGGEMFKKQDKVHLEAMAAMQEMMKNPGEMQQWFMKKKSEFEALPSD